MDWAVHASHEMTLDEVRSMTSDKFTGFVDGMFVAAGDDLIAMRFKQGGNYESVTRALWQRLCAEGGIAVDVGTHSGLFTLDAYRAGAELVFSVEPHPVNYARMVANLRINGFSTEGAFYGAAGDAISILDFHANDMHRVHAAGEIGRQSRKGERFPVRVMRLDRLIPKAMWPRIRVVKIDAENYTPNVLDGMTAILDAHRPDLIIECIRGGMGEKLKALGYRFWRIWETGRIEEVPDLEPYNPENNYNGTNESCRNRFASVNGLPEEL